MEAGTVLSPTKVLDRFYLDTRCMLLEIAATLDRHDRAAQRDGEASTRLDPRLDRVYRSLTLLAESTTSSDRAERLLGLFSEDD